MTVVETVLVFVVAPLSVVLLLALLTYLPGGRQRRPRYKPGQPWEHPPVWFEPHPDHGPAAGGHDSEPQALGSSVYPELPSGGRESAGAGSGAAAHGATAVSTAPPPDLGGPLGGARGTW